PAQRGGRGGGEHRPVLQGDRRRRGRGRGRGRHGGWFRRVRGCRHGDRDGRRQHRLGRGRFGLRRRRVRRGRVRSGNRLRLDRNGEQLRRQRQQCPGGR